MSGRINQLERSEKKVVISRIGQRRQMVIPQSIFDSLHLTMGDFVEITGNGAGSFSVKRKPLVDADDVLTPAEAKKARASLKRAREGKTRSWDVVKRELGL